MGPHKSLLLWARPVRVCRAGVLPDGV